MTKKNNNKGAGSTVAVQVKARQSAAKQQNTKQRITVTGNSLANVGLGVYHSTDTMNDYIDCVTEPVEYLTGSRTVPAPPNAVGTTVAPLKATGSVDWLADSPLITQAGLASTTQVGGTVIATNTPGETRLLVSGRAASSPYAAFSLETFVPILQPSSVNVDGTLVTPIFFYADGVGELIASFSEVTGAYLMAMPNLAGTRAFPVNVPLGSTRGMNFVVDAPDAKGIVQVSLDYYNGSVWTNAVDLNLTPGSGSGTWTPADGVVIRALRIACASSTIQMLRVECNLVCTDAETYFSALSSVYLLAPVKSLFSGPIASGYIKSFYRIAMGEVITNVTKIIDMSSVIYGVSSQRFAGFYNAEGDTLADMISNSQINFGTFPASEGISGWFQPAMLEPFPLPFDERGFGSDARLYYVQSPADNAQSFRIAYATAIGAIGVRSALTQYVMPSYPAYWAIVCNAFGIVNPISCNPGHLSMAREVTRALGGWLKKPENRNKLVTGAITAADLVSKLTASIAPRVSGAASQASSVLGYFR